jgi:hypothetical protein
MLKKILIALLVIFVLIQFYRPARNHSGDTTHDISTKFPVPDSVAQVLAVSCNDCHTNNTRYPWYAEIQPVNYWLSDHIKDGKRHLNFNTFTALAAARQFKRMDDCLEQIDSSEMPLDSYTWIHKDAILTPASKALLKGWFQSIKDSLKARYPADSLVLPKRKPANKS